MDIELKPGLFAEAHAVVESGQTAKSVGSGGLAVLATPMMIALMENAAFNAVQPLLPVGHTTVGIRIDALHLAATPVGMKVRAKATLAEVSGRKLVFDIEAFDERDKIGEARHERFVVDESRFVQKACEKAHTS